MNAIASTAEQLDQRADHFIYGDGNDAAVGIGFALRALTSAVLATVQDREFEIRKTALLASAAAHGGGEWHRDAVIADAESFESYLRGAK